MSLADCGGTLNENSRPVAGLHERHLSGEPKSLATARRPSTTVKFMRPRPGYCVMDADSGEHLEALRLQDWGRRNASPRAHQIQIRTFWGPELRLRVANDNGH